jgi:hypothetical protein
MMLWWLNTPTRSAISISLDFYPLLHSVADRQDSGACGCGATNAQPSTLPVVACFGAELT